jgi:transposase InsO family protein
VLDLFSRKIVGWAMENHLRSELMLAAINVAITMREPRGNPSLRPRLSVHPLRLWQALSESGRHAVDGHRPRPSFRADFPKAETPVRFR